MTLLNWSMAVKTRNDAPHVRGNNPDEGMGQNGPFTTILNSSVG